MQLLFVSMLLATVSCSHHKGGHPSNVYTATNVSFSTPMKNVMTALLEKPSSLSSRQDATPTSSAKLATARISKPHISSSVTPNSYQIVHRNQYSSGPFQGPPRQFNQIHQHSPLPSPYQTQQRYPSYQSSPPYQQFPISSHQYNNPSHPNHSPHANYPQHSSYPPHSSYPTHHSHPTSSYPHSPALQHYSTSHQHHFYPHQENNPQPNSYPQSHSTPNSHHGSHQHHAPSELLELMSSLKKEDTFFPTPAGTSSGSLYGFLMPLVLLGISIPAIGFMYTYLSRRSFSSTLQDYIRPPSPEDLDYYTKLVHRSIQCLQSPSDCI